MVAQAHPRAFPTSVYRNVTTTEDGPLRKPAQDVTPSPLPCGQWRLIFEAPVIRLYRDTVRLDGGCRADEVYRGPRAEAENVTAHATSLTSPQSPRLTHCRARIGRRLSCDRELGSSWLANQRRRGFGWWLGSRSIPARLPPRALRWPPPPNMTRLTLGGRSSHQRLTRCRQRSPSRWRPGAVSRLRLLPKLVAG